MKLCVQFNLSALSAYTDRHCCGIQRTIRLCAGKLHPDYTVISNGMFAWFRSHIPPASCSTHNLQTGLAPYRHNRFKIILRQLGHAESVASGLNNAAKTALPGTVVNSPFAWFDS